MSQSFQVRISKPHEWSDGSEMDANPEPAAGLKSAEIEILEQKLKELEVQKQQAHSDFEAETRRSHLKLEEKLKELSIESVAIRRNLDDHLAYALPMRRIANTRGAANPSRVADLPPEIIRFILYWALPPSFLLDSALERGPHSSWAQVLRHKKWIVRVCRKWYVVGTEFLYQDVVFRRVGQIPAFLRTLKSSPAFFGDAVKAITFSAYVPKNFGASFTQLSRQILGLCPRLQRVIFNSLFTLPPSATVSVIPQHIAHLDFGLSSIGYVLILPVLLHLSPTLSSLSIHLFCATTDSGLSTPIHFPQIESLECNCRPRTYGSREATGVNLQAALLTLKDAWSLPKLKRLSSKSSNLGGHVPISAIASFCAKHGKGLRFFQRITDEYDETLNIQTILDACPKLEHLVFTIRLLLPELSHRNVKWIDILSRDTTTAHQRHSLDHLKRTFARLQGVRLISYALRDLELPTHFPPDKVAGINDIFAYRIPGLNLRHDVGLLYAAPVPGPLCGYELDGLNYSKAADVRSMVEDALNGYKQDETSDSDKSSSCDSQDEDYVFEESSDDETETSDDSEDTSGEGSLDEDADLEMLSA
ncbi:hypothetical protein Hypma_000308 [Hypsizygus marmoreus]|uniref:F-box domain-containing protein n=1 Tax=Hypsizygus marmoreus TaxID=39966 RepID=A0A369JFR8_HYPMA|nr:hypothetical protein Hypma_000308 [Hypsizygus marmoreus]